MASAGTLNWRIQVQRVEIQANEFNEPVETWVDLVSVWAERKEVSARERLAAQQVGAELTTRFTIRYSSQTKDINPRDRIVFDGNIYNITATRNIDRNRWREIDAVVKAPMPELVLSPASPTGDAGDSLALFDEGGVTLLHLGMI
jgi:SPP1 family predicted phage head-tail adaptor